MANQKVNTNSLIFKASLLSISLMLTTGGSIAPTVTKMAESFEGVSVTAVESLVTAPNISVMIAIMISAYLVNFLGMRRTVLFGLVLSTIGGIFPFFSDNFAAIYFSRVALGFGFGMFNSLAVSILSEFYIGDQLDKMLGYQSAVQSIGLTLTMFIAGILVNVQWHYAYVIYALSIVPLILFYFNVPDVKKGTNTLLTEETKPKQKITTFAVLAAVGMALTWIFQISINLKATALVQESGMSNAGFIGTALSIFTLASFVGNVLYGTVVKYTKKMTLPIMFLIIAICNLGIAYASSMAMLTIILVFYGLGWSLFLPYCFGKVMEKAPEGSENLSVSIAMVGCNLGCYVSPFVLAALGNALGNISAQFTFTLAGIAFLLFMAVTFVLAFKKETIANQELPKSNEG